MKKFIKHINKTLKRGDLIRWQKNKMIIIGMKIE